MSRTNVTALIMLFSVGCLNEPQTHPLPEKQSNEVAVSEEIHATKGSRDEINRRLADAVGSGRYYVLRGDNIVGVELRGHTVTEEILDALVEAEHLEVLQIGDSGFTDSQLARLGGLRNLVKVSLLGTAISDRGLVHVKSWRRLRELNLQQTRITDHGLAHLVGLPNLESIHLRGARISDEALTHLVAIPNLKELNLYKTAVTQEGVEEFQRALPICQVGFRR